MSDALPVRSAEDGGPMRLRAPGRRAPAEASSKPLDRIREAIGSDPRTAQITMEFGALCDALLDYWEAIEVFQNGPDDSDLNLAQERLSRGHAAAGMLLGRKPEAEDEAHQPRTASSASSRPGPRQTHEP